ncbi:16S rRNA (uracil(1498)-N(3))-methyltransferase [Sneathiella limimaris]|uniref:16S rRNA (uracil(1498)-N(3))-methyltransferase n=1 Tax=Sneathiella limimaris TaxID=1964213 RepID=UPI00146C794F|nr:16S rRNA (uracil(1498)-N(3))-methyltransferase [Sneathiella limimaris]
MAQKQFQVRLFVDADLGVDVGIALDQAQAHYVGTVMRKSVGDELLLFNGRDGEWLGEIQDIRKKQVLVHIKEQIRSQSAGPDIRLYFAPVKKIQTNLILQKATELGVSELVPVQTTRTNADRLREDKMLAQVIEAAEQCERLTVPTIRPLVKLDKALQEMEADRPLIFCHERFDGKDPISGLATIKGAGRYAVLIGPEGGFTDEEREKIMSCDGAHTLSLGPRILRAETAVAASLTLLQAVCGDWT